MTEGLIDQLVNELTDPDFTGRKHYSRSTYKDGCHGPLCTKSERDRAAKKRERLKPDRRVVPRAPELVALDAHLETVITALGLRNDEQAEVLAGQLAG